MAAFMFVFAPMETKTRYNRNCPAPEAFQVSNRLTGVNDKIIAAKEEIRSAHAVGERKGARRAMNCAIKTNSVAKRPPTRMAPPILVTMP